jgi:fluoroacetyl-CoA thioesterase
MQTAQLVYLVSVLSLTKGMFKEIMTEVTREMTAKHLGSGSAEVLSTPTMILLMEEAARILAEEYLPEGKTTVGVAVNVRHVRAVPLGEKVVVRAEVMAVEGKRVMYWVEAKWKNRLVGYGYHERAIIDIEEFNKKLNEERNQ